MIYGNRTVHQTMLNTTAIVFKRATFPKGVNIVLLAKSADNDCYLKTSVPSSLPKNRTMKVEIVIKEMTEDPLLSTGIVIAGYVATCELQNI